MLWFICMADRLHESAFPRLSPHELEGIRRLAEVRDYDDGEIVFRAGDVALGLIVVESGSIDILNPADNGSLVITHEPGTFAGDIDILTRRPVIVTGVSRGQTRVLKVADDKLREMLNYVPGFGQKLMLALTTRRELLSASGVLGHKVVGPGYCKDTNLVREFLYRNFVPFTWLDTETPEGKEAYVALGSPRLTPVIETISGQKLVCPPLHDLARAVGIWQPCPDQEVELAIVGAGPAGLSAAVYAASEGLSTIVIDRLGPGGQAAGSSRIENFIGFPAGLTGNELATRGVLQLLKFGASISVPLCVEQLEPAPSPQEPHTLVLDCGARIRAHAILVASGIGLRKLEAEGAARFEDEGVYYACTSVEALLYDNCDIAVVGAGNSAGQAAMFLAECCRTRRVHLLVRHELGPSMSHYLAARIRRTDNILIHEHVEIAAVHGNHRVHSVELKSNGPLDQPVIPCRAVFVFIGADPSAPWLPESVLRDKLGYILTGTDVMRSGHWPIADRDPCPLETTVPGILAAGDIRCGSTKRVGFAVGDGSLAVTCVHRLRALRP